MRQLLRDSKRLEMTTHFIYNDGGRAAAGFKGQAGDCVCRAAAIASGRSYAEIYNLVIGLSSRERRSKRKRGKSNPREGVYKPTTRRLFEYLGFTWTPTMQIGSGCKVHLRKDELPSGRIVVNLSGHVSAVIDGVIHDVYDPSRNGTRCVYGYWTAPLSSPA